MDQEDLANIQLGVSEQEGEQNSDEVLVVFLSPPHPIHQQVVFPQPSRYTPNLNAHPPCFYCHDLLLLN